MFFANYHLIFAAIDKQYTSPWHIFPLLSTQKQKRKWWMKMKKYVYI